MLSCCQPHPPCASVALLVWLVVARWLCVSVYEREKETFRANTDSSFKCVYVCVCN